jgi:hypothetical protein
VIDQNLIRGLFLEYIILGQDQEENKCQKAFESQNGSNLPAQPPEMV